MIHRTEPQIHRLAAQAAAVVEACEREIKDTDSIDRLLELHERRERMAGIIQTILWLTVEAHPDPITVNNMEVTND